MNKQEYIEYLSKNYDVEFKKATYITDEPILSYEDEFVCDGYLSQDNCFYDVDNCKQFIREIAIDVVNSEKLLYERDFIPFSKWIYEIDIAIYWNGSNWICEELIDDKEY